MVALTSGIVLRKIKFGDSSQIIHIFTRNFGLQSCMLKGLGSGRKSNQKANLLFPASLVEISLYYREEKNIKLLKEVQPAYFYQSLGENIPKNCVAVFAMEVLQNLLLNDDAQQGLFNFSQSFLKALDRADNTEIANYPLYFLVQAGKHAGYQLSGNYCPATPYLNMNDGCFEARESIQSTNIISDSAVFMSRINGAKSLKEAIQINMNHEMRKTVLQQFLHFFELHLPRFHPLKSVSILSGILS